MDSLTKPKRSISPHQPPVSAKKFKAEDVAKWSSPAPTDRLFQDQPQVNGVERIRFDNSGPRRGDPIFRDHYRKKVSERSDALVRMGKKVVGSTDGIWLSVVSVSQ